MKTILIGIGLLLGCATARADLAGDFRELSAKIPFLESAQLCHDRPPDRLTLRLLTEEEKTAVLRYRELAHAADVPAILRAMQDHDAKVRGLAIFALHWSGDTRHLPFLARQTGDKALAIPFRSPVAYALRFDEPGEQDPLELRKKETFEPRTVGDYAVQVLRLYMQASNAAFSWKGWPDHPGFAGYWAARKDRKYCLGWFKVDMQLASQRIAPTRKDRVDEITALRRRIDAVPSPDREWILLSLAAPREGGDPPAGATALAPEADLVAAGKRLGPDRIMTLFKRGRISDDPDMVLSDDGKNTGFTYDRVTLFLLRHASEVLKPDLADALLELEQKNWNRLRARQDHFVTPRWATAAADLQPKRAGEILHAAMKRFSNGSGSHDQDNRAMIAVALWEHEAANAIPVITKWFFNDRPSRGAMGFGRHRLPGYLEAPERKPLLKAVLGDARMKNLDWTTLNRLIRAANRHAPEPLVSDRELRKAWHPLGAGHYEWKKDEALAKYPKETEALEAVLAEWREKLKVFAEKP